MAREILLQDAGEDTIHANEIKLETPKQKRQNWWYYHKVKLLVAIVLIGMAVSLVYSIVSKVEPDYTIALMTSYSMPSKGLEELERCIVPYADDRNGDGQVKVSVMNYILSNENANSGEQAQMMQAELAKFAADCSINTSMIFLHDEVAFNTMKLNLGGMFLYNDGTPMPDEAEDFENAMIPWKDVKAFDQFQPQGEEEGCTTEVLETLFGRLRVSLRAAEGTSVAHSEKDMAYHADSLKLFDRLEAGTPLDKEE